MHINKYGMASARKWVTDYHFETWYEFAGEGQFDGQGDHHIPKPYVRRAFCKYLDCGIVARAWCDDCGHDYFAACSCWGGGVCWRDLA
jgi:hypothetical protein